MKVLHLPSSVGGNAWNLAQGEKSLGLESKVLLLATPWAGYRSDINIHLPAATSKAGKIWRLAKTFLSIRNDYHVFHFNFGSSLINFPQFHLNQAELPFYPKKAALLVTYNGCDARQKFPTMKRTAVAACHENNCYGGQCNSGILDHHRRQGIEKMRRYVRHIWAVNPDLLYFLPPDKSSFLPYAVGSENNARLPPHQRSKPLKVLHAPTDREAKGTKYIFSAIDKVNRLRPGSISLELVEGMSHSAAIRKYREADLVIDQVLIGWYGAFAIEVMLMGKPVISRIAHEDLHFIPKAMAHDLAEAIISSEPDTLFDALMRCIDDQDYLARVAEAGQAYARRWHDPRYVATLTKDKYEEALS